MSFQAKTVLNGFLCAVIFTGACIALIWTAPTVWAAQPEDYPTHKEIMNYMNQENARVAVIEAYTEELKGANLRNRVTAMESSLATLMKLAWFTVAGVFLPWAKGMFLMYQRVGRRQSNAYGQFDLKGKIDGDA